MGEQATWLEWVQQLRAIAQNGLAYSQNPFDLERYHQIEAVTAEILAAHLNLDVATVNGRFPLESGYATPKVDVRGAVFADDKVLLVKEAADGLLHYQHPSLPTDFD